MVRLLKRFAIVFECALSAGAFLAGALITFVMVSIASDVVMRYFFGHPQIWVLETAEISLLYMTFLASAWVLKKEGHVRMDLLLNRLNPGSQALWNGITSIFGSVVCFIMTWYGAQFTWDQFVRHVRPETLLGISNGFIVVIIPIGSFLLLIQFLRRSAECFDQWRSHR
jgi:C4-dicarboxylate transporter DctQ subunit